MTVSTKSSQLLGTFIPGISYGYKHSNIFIQLRLCYLNTGYLNISCIQLLSLYMLSSINQVNILNISFFSDHHYFTIRLLYPYVYGIVQDSFSSLITLQYLKRG